MSDRKLAFITGASSGIGAAFARQLAAEGYDLILVARGADRLATLAGELTAASGGAIEHIAADLSTEEGCMTVEARLRSDPVDLLVNNAGTSLNTPFVHANVADEEGQLRLNVHSVMRLTLAALPGMVERRGGEIVNVSSVAAFAAVMPGSTYSASKAWVTNFSESIAYLVAPNGVRVMALHPGYTRTGMHARVGIDMSGTPDWMWLKADNVVREALRDLRRGKILSVPDVRYKVAVWALRHLPRRLLASVSRDVRGRTGRPAPSDSAA